MRRRLARILTAAILVVGLSVPNTARPAAAIDIGTIIAVAKQIYSLYKQYKDFTQTGHGLTLDQATAQILTAINNSETAIIDQIDHVAAAQVQACAAATVIDFVDIESFSPDTLQDFARDATSCVTLADSLLSTIADKATIDQLSFALNEVGPLALMARNRAGFSTTTLTTTLIHANNTARTGLAPSCLTQLQGVGSAGPLPGNVYVAWVQCTAYNGDIGTRATSVRWPPSSNPFDIAGATTDALRNTSLPVIVAALAALQP